VPIVPVVYNQHATPPKNAIKINYINPPPPLKQKIRREFIETGDMSAVDGSLAHRLRGGKYPIDATLDLHGKTQDQAFALINHYITNAYNMGNRCILIITGKGHNGLGILREQLPKWLNNSHLKDYILTISHANQKHGGTGSFYVLLRKNRQE
jgi:DNA-nicking Smr family endonuclease